MEQLGHVLTRLGTIAGHPLAFVTVAAYGLVWLLFSPGTLDWHAAATLATWCMTLFIQRAEHRDTQAIHAKLDELLRAEERARDELTQIDKEEPEDVERKRAEAERRAG
jgi:low affinity Fe/Cu permease